MNDFKVGTAVILAMPLVIGSMFLLGPMIRRRSLLFGVRVSQAWTETGEAGRIIRNYRIQIGVLTLLATAAAWLGFENRMAWIQVAWPLALTGGALLPYFAARRAALPYADRTEPARTAALLDDSPGSNPAHSIIPLLLMVLAAAWLQMHWDEIPDRFPIHWDIAGRPNGWSTRTVPGVYGPLLIGVFILVVLKLSEWGILYGSPRVAGGSATVRWQSLRMLQRMGCLMGILFSSIALAPLRPDLFRPGLIVFVILFAVALMVIPLIRAAGNPEGSVADNTPDSAWKFGLIYYNPDDPALMVEKRIGIGYTLNFAHRLAWVSMAALLLIPIGILILKRMG